MDGEVICFADAAMDWQLWAISGISGYDSTAFLPVVCYSGISCLDLWICIRDSSVRHQIWRTVFTFSDTVMRNWYQTAFLRYQLSSDCEKQMMSIEVLLPLEFCWHSWHCFEQQGCGFSKKSGFCLQVWTRARLSSRTLKSNVFFKLTIAPSGVSVCYVENKYNLILRFHLCWTALMWFLNFAVVLWQLSVMSGIFLLLYFCLVQGMREH